MEIKSEFKLQEEVYVIGDTTVPLTKINAVHITVDEDNVVEILYETTHKESECIHVKDIFKTKNDAKNYLSCGEHTKYDKDNLIAKTESSIGDNVWFMKNGSIHNGNISEIKINKFISAISHNEECYEKYTVKCSEDGQYNLYPFKDTKKLYSTKEDLMCSL